MKIVFWSDRPGHGLVTSNMLALAGIAATQYNYKCSMLQLSHLWSNGMQTAFIDTSLVSDDYFQNTGMDALLRTVKTGATEKQQIINCGISFLNRNLDLYLPTKEEIPENYYKELLEQEEALMSALDSSYDLAFFDAGSGSSPHAIKAMEEADVIVICLPENTFAVQEFLKNCHIEANNLYFLFGSYNKDSVMNVKNLCKKFKKSGLLTKNTGIIPYDIGFSDAISTSTLSRFFLSNKETTSKDAAHNFIKQTKTTFADIMKYVGYNVVSE